MFVVVILPIEERQVNRKGVNNLTKSSNQEHRTKVETNSGTASSDETGIFL